MMIIFDQKGFTHDEWAAKIQSEFAVFLGHQSTGFQRSLIEILGKRTYDWDFRVSRSGESGTELVTLRKGDIGKWEYFGGYYIRTEEDAVMFKLRY
jgi:hypothetical protein